MTAPDGNGWANVAFGGEATYSPEDGLTVPLIVTAFAADGMSTADGRIDVHVNQASGLVGVR